MRRMYLVAAVIAAVLAGLVSGPAYATHAVATCNVTLTASAGPDYYGGDLEAYLETNYGLLAHQTVCLRGGDYYSSGNSLGLNGVSQLALRTSPGDSGAIIRSQFKTDDSADGLYLFGLKLHGDNYTGSDGTVHLAGDNGTFERVDVNGGGANNNCVLGDQSNPAQNITITLSRIFYCGADTADAAEHQHGIYINVGTGWTIKRNYIYENAGRGIQMYSNSDGNDIYWNVIAQNCRSGTPCSGQVIYAGCNDASVASGACSSVRASDDNDVHDNTIAYVKDPAQRWNVTEYRQDYSTGGNYLRNNCLWSENASDRGRLDTPFDSVVLLGNFEANPEFSTDTFYGYTGGFMSERNYRPRGNGNDSACWGNDPRVDYTTVGAP